MAKAVILFL